MAASSQILKTGLAQTQPRPLSILQQLVSSVLPECLQLPLSLIPFQTNSLLSWWILSPDASGC